MDKTKTDQIGILLIESASAFATGQGLLEQATEKLAELQNEHSE